MAPDPRRVRSESISPIKGDEFTLDETETDDEVIVTPEGYTLFTGGLDHPFEVYGIDSDVTDDDDYENDDENDCEDNTEENTPNVALEELNNFQDTCEDACSASVSRPDIPIDCDKIKAAMVGFSLPPSSIPSWASGISDIDINHQINRILNEKKKSNK